MVIGRWVCAVVCLAMWLQAAGPGTRAVAPASPPSGQIAYQGVDRRLHIVNADGTGDRLLATRGDAYAPRWSPAGDELVYDDELPEAPFKGQLAAIAPATGVTRAIVPPALRDPNLGTYYAFQQPRWTPDGGAILYLQNGGSRLTSVMRVAAVGGQPEELFFGISTTRFDVSPADSRIALSDDAFAEEAVQGSRLVVLDQDGGNERTILPRNGSYYFQPTWSPDGRQILVRRQAERTSTTATLLLINPGDNTQRTLGTVAAGTTYAFSPDGMWLVLAAGDTKRLTVASLADFAGQRDIGQGVAPTWGASRYFPETGFRVSGRFLQYWERNGGLPIHGYPLTGEIRETLEDGKPYTVQYFERARLEYHPEQADPQYQVLLGQFGRRIHPADPPVARLPGGAYQYFDATGHNVGKRFIGYWEAHGGLAQFGYPISEELIETLEDGRPYLVQYFERARFEYHPENQTPYDVLLGQFGRRILAERGR